MASTVMGAAIGLLAYFGRSYYIDAIDFMEQDLGDKLRRLQMSPRNLRHYLLAWSVGLVLIFLVLWLVAESPIFAVLSTIFLLCGPWYWVRRRAEKHRQQIEDQLADSIVSLSGAIKAGLSLAQSMEVLAEQSPRPINAEFQRIVGEYNMGKPLDRTLQEAKERLRSENFALFAAALLASRESGGRLNETVERIANSVRELQRLERKVQSETAMARKSAVYMALVPFFILAFYYFFDPAGVEMLFTTPPGQLLMAVAIVLNVIAYLWARAIMNPDI